MGEAPFTEAKEDAFKWNQWSVKTTSVFHSETYRCQLCLQLSSLSPPFYFPLASHSEASISDSVLTLNLTSHSLWLNTHQMDCQRRNGPQPQGSSFTVYEDFQSLSQDGSIDFTHTNQVKKKEQKSRLRDVNTFILLFGQYTRPFFCRWALQSSVLQLCNFATLQPCVYFTTWNRAAKSEGFQDSDHINELTR